MLPTLIYFFIERIFENAILSVIKDEYVYMCIFFSVSDSVKMKEKCFFIESMNVKYVLFEIVFLLFIYY